MNAFQATLPASVDFPQYLQDNTYQWQVPDIKQPAADTATDIYNIANGAEKLQEKIVIQNDAAFPLLVCVNDVCEVNKYHFILPAASALKSGNGGTYIFYPRLEGVRRISVISVGGAGQINSTKITCIKDL